MSAPPPPVAKPPFLFLRHDIRLLDEFITAVPLGGCQSMMLAMITTLDILWTGASAGVCTWLSAR